MYQLILQKQLDLAYYAHISLESSDKLPISDFNFHYEYLAEKVALDRESESDKLILLSQAVKGAKLQKKNSVSKEGNYNLPD